jgi:hypothetical protein
MSSNYEIWNTDSADFPAKSPLRQQIEFVCNYGIMAPSVHNTQPWRISIGDSSLTVSIDPKRKLGDGDATGRQTWVSLGCFVQTYVEAASALGLKIDSVKVNEGSESVKISVAKALSKQKVDQGVLVSIRDRVTNRSIYDSKSIKPQDLKFIQNKWKSSTSQVLVTSDQAIIKKVAALTSQGIAMALSIDAFKAEIANLMRPNSTSHTTGMPGFAFGHGHLRSIIEPWRFRHTQVAAKEAAHEKQLLGSAPAMALVFTKGDTAEFWVEGGRAYVSTAIAATGRGVSSSTYAAAVEAPDFHLEVEEAVGTKYRLQAVLRLGYSSNQPRHSPRGQVVDFIT